MNIFNKQGCIKLITIDSNIKINAALLLFVFMEKILKKTYHGFHKSIKEMH